MKPSDTLLETGSILTRLRVETADAHTALETRLPFLHPGFTRPEYGELLSRFWGYYVTLEPRLIAGPSLGYPAFNYSDRLKTPLLERDLCVLGETRESIAQVPRCDDLPPITTVAELLGCLYVIEGSTLGGMVIQQHLQANLGVTREEGCAFFNAYGPETREKWQGFRAVMLSATARFGGEDAIVLTARRTFETLDRWLSPIRNS